MTNLNKEISDTLKNYQRAKNAVKDLRVEMLRLAVEGLGMDQKDAQQANLEVFFDGYLIGQRMIGKS